MQIDSSSIGILVHDLKGPVGNIGMFSEMLVSMLESAQEELGTSYDLSSSIWYAQYMQTISSKYIDQLQNWSDLYLLNSDSVRLNTTYVDLSFLLQSVLKENSLFINKKNLVLDIDIQSGIVFQTDSDLFRRVFDNLIQIVVLLIAQKETVNISFNSTEEKAEFSISGLQIHDKQLIENLYLQKIDISDKTAFTKGIIKTTGLGLAFCFAALNHFNCSTFLNEKDSKLRMGFTIPLSA